MSKLKFGKMVKFTKQYKRAYSRFGHRDWVPLTRTGEGVYLGGRTIQNGIVHSDDESGTYFCPSSYIRVALVCPSDRENPIYVPMECVDV